MAKELLDYFSPVRAFADNINTNYEATTISTLLFFFHSVFREKTTGIHLPH